MPRTAASPWEIIIVSAGIVVVGPRSAIFVIFGVPLYATLGSPSGAQPPAGSHLYSSGSYGFSSPDSIAVDGSHIWVANLGGSVTELNADNGSLVRTLSGSGYGFNTPWAIAADGTNVWVANHGGNSVTEFPAG